MNVALVEDDTVEAETMKTHLCRYGKEQNINFDITHFKTAESFLKNYRQSYYSVVLMDVEMPGISGMDAARRLRELDTQVVLVFVTKMSQYAQKGYEVNALDFILKPVRYSDFCLKLKKAINVSRQNEVRSVLVPVSSGFCCVSSDKLIFVEVMGHQIKYQLVDEKIEARGSLSEAEKTLKAFGFLRCNSCYLVNPKFVNSVKGNDVDVGGYILKISHPRRKNFIQGIMDYLGGRELKK